MKKALYLVLALLVSHTLFSCHIVETSSETEKPTSETLVSTPTENTTPSDVDASEPEVSTNGEDAATTTVEPDISTPTDSTPSVTPTYTLSNAVIIDNDICTFTITEVDPSNSWGFTLKSSNTNKTASTNLSFSVDDVSVNGYMIDPFWSTSALPGKTELSDISFSNATLSSLGITSVDEVEFRLRISDQDDWTSDALVDEVFTIYPTGKTADKISIPERPKSENETILIDNAEYTFIILDPYMDPLWGYSLPCFIENKTNIKTGFSWDDVSVNGFMVDPFWSTSVPSGKRSVSTINFSSSSLEEAGITSIEEIDLTFSISDYENWFADALLKQSVSYHPVAIDLGLTDKSDSISQTTKLYTLSNEVVVDNDICAFTISGINPDSIWGFAVNSVVENKSTDINLSFSIDNVSINGYMVDPFWAASATPGKKNISEIDFSRTALEQCGIDTVDEIEFRLRVSDDDDWSKDPYVDEVFRIYPTGKMAGDIVIPEKPAGASEKVIVDNDQVKFIILDPYDDEIWGYSVRFYIENNTDKNLSFSWNDVAVNSYMMDPFWSTSVGSGKRKVTSASFSSSDFEASGITAVSEIDFRLTISDADNWFADAIIDSTFSYEP